MEILLQDLLPGQEYLIQLRAKNQTGYSQWSRAYSFTTSSDVTAPNPATGLTWNVSGTSFVGAWTAPTLDSDGGPLRDFKAFKVTLTAAATDVVFYVQEPRFDLSLSRNTTAFGSPKPSVAIKVEAMDTIGNLSIPVTASATNAIPSDVTNFDAVAALGGVNLSWDHVADNDLKQYEIYVGSTSGFTPGPSNLKVVTTANAVFYATTDLTLQYYKIRAVDVFNQGSANYTVDSQVAYPLDGVPDSTAPSQPSAPTVSTGTLMAQVSHAMTKQAGGNLESDVEYLEVHASTTTGFTPSSSTLRGTIDSAGQGIAVSAAFFFPTTDSMTNLYWKVIAVDRSRNKSSASNQTTGLPNLIENANILAATITDAKIQNLSAAKLVAGTAIINDLFVQSNLTVSSTGLIKSSNFVLGTSGWQIKADGSAEFNNVVVRGELLVDGANGLEQVRVYPLSGIPTIEWTSEFGEVWECYAVDTGSGSYLKITHPTSGGIFWVKDQGTAIVRDNIADYGLVQLNSDGFIRRGRVVPTATEDWINFSFATGWTTGTPSCQYKLFPDGMVRLRGVANHTAAGSPGAGSLVTTLPTGYRPARYTLIPNAYDASATKGRVQIDVDGTVRVFDAPNDFPFFDGIQFSVL